MKYMTLMQMIRWCMTMVLTMAVAHAQTGSQDPGRSYADRQNPRLSKSGPIYMDPNVYAYSAEFAKRFQMPEQWIAPDLKGADAVAWRMMPSYQECGWGGDPKACRTCTLTISETLYLGMPSGLKGTAQFLAHPSTFWRTSLEEKR
jgi:hypothetical protein